ASMTRSKPPLVRLCELKSGEAGDFFVYLAEHHRGATRDGKPFYTCRFRDAGRTATVMVWQDGGRFEECEAKWAEGGFYKIRGTHHDNERYGPQIDIHQIRPVQDGDREDGF